MLRATVFLLIAFSGWVEAGFGTYSGPVTMGISNNVPAITNGASFVSPRITLAPGANPLTIRYAAMDLAPVTIACPMQGVIVPAMLASQLLECFARLFAL
jgi:hypothetical protein